MKHFFATTADRLVWFILGVDCLLQGEVLILFVETETAMNVIAVQLVLLCRLMLGMFLVLVTVCSPEDSILLDLLN